ncbi:hypothetical protein [Aquiflexum sp.]
MIQNGLEVPVRYATGAQAWRIAELKNWKNARLPKLITGIKVE